MGSPASGRVRRDRWVDSWSLEAHMSQTNVREIPTTDGKGLKSFVALERRRGGAAARCAALINRRYQEAKNVKRGFIGWFSALPGEDAAVRAMFERAETWLKDRGVDHIVAPFNG